MIHPMACIRSPCFPRYALRIPLSTWGKTSAMALTSSSFAMAIGELRAGNDDLPILPFSIDFVVACVLAVLILDSDVSRLDRPPGMSELDRSSLVLGGGVYEPILGLRGPIGADMDGWTRGAP